MQFTPMVYDQPKKDESGNYRCKSCDLIIPEKTNFCEKCESERNQANIKFIKNIGGF